MEVDVKSKSSIKQLALYKAIFKNKAFFKIKQVHNKIIFILRKKNENVKRMRYYNKISKLNFWII